MSTPPPDTVSDAMRAILGDSSVELFRQLMAEGSYAVRYPEPVDSLPSECPAGHVSETATLTIRRAAAPAPYVGRPFRYMWKVAIDEAHPERYVSGTAEQWMMPEPDSFEYYAADA